MRCFILQSKPYRCGPVLQQLVTLRLIALLSVNLIYTAPAGAQSDTTNFAKIKIQIEAMQQQLTELQGIVTEQQRTIATLASENKQLKAGGQPAATPAPTTAISQFNPDIGMVADIVGTSSQSSSDLEGNDRLSVREIELTIGHDIDPYARFDSVITFSDFESPDIEEAFVSYWGLPSDTKGRIGRFRPKIGIQSAIHRDRLETVDEPLVIQRYLGIEGLFRTGVEVANFIPFGWNNPSHELTLGLLEGGVGEGGELLGETRRIPTFYTRLRNSYDLSADHQLDLGGTYLRGSSSSSYADGVNLLIADLSYSH
ncbi:MAG: hypothetical protein EBZ48_08875, partial [Proteobacteria bacterium]|nr:hypothetical protein [Pseudomonadota bacterium]